MKSPSFVDAEERMAEEGAAFLHANNTKYEEHPMRLLGAALCALLVLQTTSFGLIRSHFERHACDTVILGISEIAKGSISLVATRWHTEHDVIFFDVRSWMYASVPGILYTIMNGIGMGVTPYINATVFSIIMQMKLVFTLLLSATILRRRFTSGQYISVMSVMIGTIAMVVSTRRKTGTDDDGVRDVYLWAVLALFFETFLSGMSTIYVQSMFQQDKRAIWHRNVQLAVFGLLLCSVRGAIMQECAHTTSLNGHDMVLIFLNVVGGILVAFALLYAGGVEKCVATCLSVVCTIVSEKVIWKMDNMSIESTLIALLVVFSVAQYHASS